MDGCVTISQHSDTSGPAIAAPGTEELMEQTIQDIKEKKIEVFKGNYTGKDVKNPEDIINLNNGYTENESDSSPTFHYVLDDVVEIVEFEEASK